MEQNVVFHPIIISIQKIALYETKSRFYLIGSNNTQTRFRVLKIDRLEPKELSIYDDKVEYSQDEIHDLVNMIDNGNRHRSGSSGISNVTSAFGIVGFIRFLEGYYIILVTKRRKVAVIGNHTIFKIEDTCMIYIPHDSIRLLHPDEHRYVKMFQSIDLSSNFYFSYSYDISHTLQNNMCPPKHIIPHTVDAETLAELSSPTECFTSTVFSQNAKDPSVKNPSNKSNVQEDYGIRTKPHRKFVWNTHLLREVESELHPDWILYVTHGFVGQSNMSIFGRSVYVTLIARRSRKFAGTRFLKRGANFDGDVANEVETEQIIHDSSISSMSQGRFSSFVQMRGSIPVHWSQDISKMVPKPAISIDLNDPYAETAAAHFNELLKRYGAPIIILNLVKKREKKKHESFLTNELRAAVKYLNQFMPQEHQIVCICFDMARMNKSKTVNVMLRLEEIAKNAVMKTGIFLNQNRYFAQKNETVVGQALNCAKGRLQMGIIRTNCVDCLDRTNTAQFVIGKCVLGYQLCALGMLDSPKLEFDTDCVRMLESLYEDHGDTLALQYGGSQLVHRIKTYRKTAPWTSQGNDIMQTLSRYYSNTFSDAEKQNTINLFLGLFVPDEHKPQIWELFTDYYFHNRAVFATAPEKPLTQWWDRNVMKCLPMAYHDVTKSCYEMIRVQSRDVEMIDAYSDYHRPFELTVLSDMFAYQISNSIRDFMPNFTTNYSPFSVRVRPGRRREETKGNAMKNPSLTGQSSTSSTASSSSAGSGSESSDDEGTINPSDSAVNDSKEKESLESNTFETLFPTMRQVYGTELVLPERSDLLRYRKYVQIGRKSSGTLKHNILSKPLRLERQSSFTTDSSFSVKPPSVDKTSLNIYKKYIETGIKGGFEPEAKDMNMYMNYVLIGNNFIPKHSKSMIRNVLDFI